MGENSPVNECAAPRDAAGIAGNERKNSPSG